MALLVKKGIISHRLDRKRSQMVGVATNTHYGSPWPWYPCCVDWMRTIPYDHQNEVHMTSKARSRQKLQHSPSSRIPLFLGKASCLILQTLKQCHGEPLWKAAEACQQETSKGTILALDPQASVEPSDNYSPKWILTSTSWKTWARISQPSCSKIIDTQILYKMINGCCPPAANSGIIRYIAIGNLQILVTRNRMMLSNTLKMHEWLWKNISVFQFCFQFRCSYIY